MATEYKLGYTGEEINRRLATVNETKNNLETNYYTSATIDTKLGEKADLVDGKIPVEQLPSVEEDYSSLINKPGDEVTTEETVNFIENQQLSGGQLVTQSIYQWGVYVTDDVPKVGQTIHLSVTTADGDKIDVGEGTLYHDADLQSMMSGGSDEMWVCCSINSTITNVAQIVTSDSMPVADESIPYAFAIIITPGDGTVGYVTVTSAGNHEGISVTLQTNKKTTSVIKLPNEALTFDETPTEGSQNLINSDVVHSEINDVHSLIEDIFGSTVENISSDFGAFRADSLVNSPIANAFAYKKGRHIWGTLSFNGVLATTDNNRHEIYFDINAQYRPSYGSTTYLPYCISSYNSSQSNTIVPTCALCRSYNNSGVIEVIIENEYDSADMNLSFDYWI